MLLLLDLVRADIARHEPGSVLTLAEFTGAQIDKSVATRMKEVLVLDRPYVKRRRGWDESVPHVFYEHFKNFSQRDFPLFKTREEAMDWLVRRRVLERTRRGLSQIRTNFVRCQSVPINDDIALLPGYD